MIFDWPIDPRTRVVEGCLHPCAVLADATLDHRRDERCLDGTAVGHRCPRHVQTCQLERAAESTLTAVTDFLPGIEPRPMATTKMLSVRSSTRRHTPRVGGWGSDVLDFDTERSTDHGWGPHLHVFVAADDVNAVRVRIRDGLPDNYRGGPPASDGTTSLPAAGSRSSRSMPGTGTLRVQPLVPRRARCSGSCSRSSSSSRWSAAASSTTTSDHSRRSASGPRGTHTMCGCGCSCRVEGSAKRRRSSGARPRSATTSDRRCSRPVGRDVMRLCFLIERRYAPYSKWFGTAFSQLDAASDVGRSLEEGDLGGATGGGHATTRSASPTPSSQPCDRLRASVCDLRRAARRVRRIQDPWLRSATHRRDRSVVRTP